MGIKHIKPIGIGYHIFGVIAVFLSLFGKISVFPIITGILIFMLYFILKAIMVLFRSNDWNWTDFVILWGIPVLFSAQILLLLNDSFKVYALATFLIVMFGILLINYRYKKETGIPFFILMQFFTMGVFNANF
jgi:hypothetical protein